MPSPYPFRYPTPSERRAMVKRHRQRAMGMFGLSVASMLLELAGGVGGWAWFFGVMVGASAGIGVGIFMAHGEED